MSAASSLTVRAMVYDSSFTGSMTLGGEGYKRAGGIAGRLSGTSSGSNNSIQSTTGNMVTADIALEGDVRFGGIAAVAVPGLGLTASVADNLYGGTLSVENGSGIVAGACSRIFGVHQQHHDAQHGQ